MWDGITLVALGRNDCQSSLIGNLLSDFSAAVGLICDDSEGIGGPVEEGMHDLAIVDLPGGYGQA